MTLRRNGRASRLAVRIGITILLAFPSFLLFPASPATAVCSSRHENADGHDNTTPFGVRSDIYVNNFNFGTLNNAIFRSLFILNSPGNDVEVGWEGSNGGHLGPDAYFEFVANGSDSGPRRGPSVTKGNFPNLKVTAPGAPNGNGNFTWTASLNGNSFDSVILGYNSGTPSTNSERYDTCDNAYGNFTLLDRCNSNSGGVCGWAGQWRSPFCFFDNMADYSVRIDDNTHIETPHVSGTC